MRHDIHSNTFSFLKFTWYQSRISEFFSEISACTNCRPQPIIIFLSFWKLQIKYSSTRFLDSVDDWISLSDHVQTDLFWGLLDELLRILSSQGFSQSSRGFSQSDLQNRFFIFKGHQKSRDRASLVRLKSSDWTVGPAIDHQIKDRIEHLGRPFILRLLRTFFGFLKPSKVSFSTHFWFDSLVKQFSSRPSNFQIHRQICLNFHINLHKYRYFITWKLDLKFRADMKEFYPFQSSIEGRPYHNFGGFFVGDLI